MSDSESGATSQEHRDDTPGRIRTVVLCAVILAAAGAAAMVIFSTEPTSKRGGARKQTAMLVEVEEVRSGTYPAILRVTGTVQAQKDVTLSSRVVGEVVWHAEEFEPGGLADEGTPLVRIDPRDYRNVVRQRKSEVRQAKTALRVEEGRVAAAKKGYELVEDVVGEDKKALVLREPQLEAARVRVEAAQAALDQAQLDLSRTTIEAPFDAQILERSVNVGSQVAPGDPLARLVGIHEYWVVTTVPVAQLRWLSFSEGDDRGSPATVRNRSSWGPGQVRHGYLDKRIGALDSQTRMARVLVVVPDPLGLQAEGEDLPELLVGAFVEVTIEGKALEGVIRIDRDHLRDRDTVWVMKDGQLDVREVEVLFRNQEHAFIAGGLEPGERIITTNLATVTEGASLRLKGSG